MAQGASGPSSAMPPQAGGGPTSPAWWWAINASTPINLVKIILPGAEAFI
eukprot:CAMPEP_0113685304 /NCGR_PEP_ID=MMETSP0038_2-20120614/14582_1 /TAXON_ID=2898 /ORGANISM="Cryptomonas paramecium" /LENGTH=49 /DNA_ID=CAMNT_0000605345 /DNA_START=294 /DNA_END=440 /DNA_ORIENTATION=- /assembly_acc=CAM_ASM_000170